MQKSEINCKCDTCDIKRICDYYQFAIKPVLDVVKNPDIPQAEPFTINLVKAVESFDCDQYE